jgi:hypothetical protein
MNKKNILIILSVLIFVLLLETVRYEVFKYEWNKEQKNFKIHVMYYGKDEFLKETLSNNPYIKGKLRFEDPTAIKSPKYIQNLLIYGTIDDVKHYKNIRKSLTKYSQVEYVNILKGNFDDSPRDPNTHCFYLCVIKIYD